MSWTLVRVWTGWGWEIGDNKNMKGEYSSKRMYYTNIADIPKLYEIPLRPLKSKKLLFTTKEV